MGLIEMGLVVGIALLFTMSKMNWRWKMRVLSNPLLVDLMVLAALLILHWGSYSGVMIATFGAMACSVILAAGRKAYGHIENGVYVPGVMDVSYKLIKE